MYHFLKIQKNCCIAWTLLLKTTKPQFLTHKGWNVIMLNIKLMAG